MCIFILIFVLYNKSPQDALFLNFILVKNSTCFRQIYCPSSGVSNTVFTAIGICHTGYVSKVRMAFIIRKYHDALSCECQIHAELCCCSSLTMISYNVLLLNVIRPPNSKQFVSSYHAAVFSDSTSQHTNKIHTSCYKNE